jgi:hypothetical protein
MGWTAERSEFESQKGKDFSLYFVHTGSETHSGSYAMGSGSFLSGGKAAEA